MNSQMEEGFGSSIYTKNPVEVEELAQKYLDALTLEEKTKFMAGDWKMSTHGIAMAIRYNSKPIPVGKIIRLNIPPWGFMDGPRGTVGGSSTCFPVSMARAATFDVKLEERIGNVIGIENRIQGADFFGGVCINLVRHPAWGRAQESYGEDPYLLGEMGAALTRGVQAHGVMACAKHYCCNSMENMRFKVDVTVDERTLREIYLPHFKKCVENDVAAIMSAYNQVNGHYCGENKHILTGILKEEWGFKGFIITDFIWGVYDGLKGIKAGLDVEMPFQSKMTPKKILKMVESGEISEERIDETVRRVLKQKLRFLGDKKPELYDRSNMACSKHTQIALEAALKSMVLLKNENKILPLNAKKVNKIAVLGDLAIAENIGDHGSSRVYPPWVVTPLQGIQEKFGYSNVLYDKGKNIKQSLLYAKEADVVIIVAGYTHNDEGEYMLGRAGDRDLLTLKPKDEKLIKKVAEVNENIIVVMVGSSAIIVEEWLDKAKGIVMGWYSGMEGGHALGQLLFGDANFSGKLPFMVPKSSDQLVFFDKKADKITYDYYHGYRLTDKKGWEPAYPFGFGLSYTTFSYGTPKLASKTISRDGVLELSLEVSNNGDIAGDEIIQLYIGYPESKVDRVVRELKAFTRINLKPNETKSVTLKVPAKDTAYYDVESKSWIVETGKYEVFIGSCNDIRSLMKLEFQIQ